MPALALANKNSSIMGLGGPFSNTPFWDLEDGSGFFLLEDGSGRWLLEIA